MALYLPIRALNRSQNVRIGGQKITSTATAWVDLSDAKTKKEFGHHSAIGAVYPVGPLSASNVSASPIVTEERTFTETTGAGVYTGSVIVPAGATIQDIIINGVALWTAATSATLKVGDVADDDGYYTAVDLKATDLLAGESLSFSLAGGKAGAYIANSQVSPRYSASQRTISGIVTTVGSTGNAGRTRMTVIYSLPVADDVVAATKV
jgi:hypothetical protein